MEKKHFYEIDLMRTFTMFGVIAVHTMTIYNSQLSDGTHSFLVMSAVHSSMHVMRMVFMFITGFVLTFSNHNRDFKVVPFWRKRIFYVIIPYVFWNIVYLMFRALYEIDFGGQPKVFLKDLARSLVHGDQFYIYYVLVTIQFYFVFPLMFWVLNKWKEYHCQIFIYSVAFQLVMNSYFKFVAPQLDTSGWPYLLSHYGTFVLTYQCYFFAGGIVACHYKDIMAFIEKHCRFFISSLGMYIVMMWIHYYFNRRFLGESDHAAQLVHQPVYLPYTLLIIAVILFIGSVWNKKRMNNQWKLFSKFIMLGSKTSFGIYLVQPFPLYVMKKYIMPHLVVNQWVFYGSLVFGVLLVYFSSMLISYIFNQTPILTYCVGKKTKWAKRIKPSQA